MKYIGTKLEQLLTIEYLYYIHYYEFAKDFVFEGERHDFWEFLFVDKGEVEIVSESKGYTLKQGEIVFHKPNEFHSVWANGKTAPNVVVVMFQSNSESMNYFKNKILTVDYKSHAVLADILKEAKDAFSSPIGRIGYEKLTSRESAQSGSQQMIKILLENFLIRLIRKDKIINTRERISSIIKERSDKNIDERIVKFLNDNIYNSINFNSVVEFTHLGKTKIKELFSYNNDMGVMEYYNNLKIEEAKKLIREKNNNFTEIALLLNYSSIHYFSRHFKEITKMTPSEYSKSLKSLYES